MYPKQSFILNILNNTGGNVPISLLNAGNPNNNIVNARTRYAWNVTAASYSPPTFSIEARLSSSQPMQVFSGNANSLSSLLVALNRLNIGLFWSEISGGNTYIVTWNDSVQYGDLIVGNPFTFEMAFQAIAPGDPITFTLNGAGTISGQIDYGDGTVSNFSAAGPLVFNHAYAAVGNYNIGIFLNTPTGITSLTAFNRRITSLTLLGNLPNLATLSLFNSLITSLDVTQNANLVSLGVQNTAFVVPGLLTSLDVTQNSLLSILSLVAHAGITSVDVTQNAALTQFSTQSCSVNDVDVSNNPLLFRLRMENNNVPVADVNTALIILDGNGLLNGTFTSFNQVPAAAPTGAGAAAKANLILKGWTVTTD